MKPNLIERLENLIAALDDADEAIQLGGDTLATHERNTQVHIWNAAGIAGEILTMIDGR